MNAQSKPARRLMVLALSAALAQAVAVMAASAASLTASGSAALALAGVVAPHSPQLGSHDKHVVARLFGGDADVPYPANKKITVKAAAVMCRASNVDITARSCILTFGSHKRTLRGREANEIYATEAVAGVPSDGAAGSIYESLSNLVCTLDPGEIRQKAGGGADCMFDAGP